MQGDVGRRQDVSGQVSTRELDRDALRDAIAQEEARLATLAAQQTESSRQLTALRAELAALDVEPEIHVQLPKPAEVLTPGTPADKDSALPLPVSRARGHLRCCCSLRRRLNSQRNWPRFVRVVARRLPGQEPLRMAGIEPNWPQRLEHLNRISEAS